MAHKTDSSSIYLNYLDFKTRFEKIDSSIDVKNIRQLIIENNNNVFHGSWHSGEDLPMGGIYFDLFDSVSKFTNVRDLRLIDLFVDILPESILKLDRLESLEVCFSRKSDVEKNLTLLIQLKKLKRLDLNGSRLSESQRDHIRETLKKSGITVNDYLMLKSQ